MKHRLLSLLALTAIALLMSMTCLTLNAEARAGGSRSTGSRGSRSYTRPASPGPAQQTAPRQATQPPPYQAPQPAGGGFFRSMAGGIAGGLLGGMLFRSLGFAGGGMGGGGIGLFEIILIGGIIYLIYRFIKKKRESEAYQSAGTSTYQTAEPAPYQQQAVSYIPPQDDVATGLSHIRQMDYSFDEQRFTDGVMDLFFKIQGAWMNRDLSPVAGLLTPQMRQNLQSDIDILLRDRKVNRLENIAVRSVDIVEAWQEAGQDYITTLIYANLLDYTTDEAGVVLAGSKTDPVKFEEYWTVTRPVGSNPWQLSAIDQK